MNAVQISVGGASLHALVLGSGPRLVLAFHGYSNNASLFQPFERALGQHYTVYAVDLPGHGRTAWPAGKDLEPAALADAVQALCTTHGVSKASLLGFSLGGRVALALLAARPALVDAAALAAPDGLAFNPFYYWVTRTVTGRAFFNNLLQRPERYVRLLGRVRQRGWLDEGRYRFLVQYLESDRSRNLLRQAWPPLRRLAPPPAAVRAAIRRHRVPVHLFMGIHDPVIPFRYGETFAKGAPDVHLHPLSKGHRLFDADTIGQMARCLLDVAP